MNKKHIVLFALIALPLAAMKRDQHPDIPGWFARSFPGLVTYIAQDMQTRMRRLPFRSPTAKEREATKKDEREF